MTDPTTVTAQGLSGGALHVVEGEDCWVWIADSYDKTAGTYIRRDALREWARDVLRMTDTGPSIFDGYSDRGLMSAWDFWSDPSTSRNDQAKIFRDEAEAELRRRGIPVPTR